MRDQFEDLEFEIDEEPTRHDASGRPRRDWSARRVPIAIGVLVFIVAAAALASRNDTKKASPPRTTAAARTTSATPFTTTATTIDDTPTTQESTASTAETLPTTTSSLYSRTAGTGPLLPTKTGTVVVARTYEGLSVVDLDTGDTGRIALRTAFSSDATALTAGADWIIERSQDSGTGSLVRLTNPPTVTPLPAGLSGIPGFSALLLGPQPNLVWVPSGGYDGSGQLQGTLALVDIDTGAPTRRITLDNNLTPVGSANNGEVYLQGIGGVYVTEGESLRRVSTGALIAAGHDTLVTVECDEHYECQRVVTSVGSGTRRVIPSAPDSGTTGSGLFGSVSPDGRYAASVEFNGSSPKLRLTDLESGDESTVDGLSTEAPFFFGQGVTWTADGRYILWVQSNTRPVAYDVPTGTLIPLEGALPSVLQLTIRPSSAGQ